MDRPQPSLGFIILSHDKPRQLRRLIDRLGSMFDAPPIVCHHDFSQCDLPGQWPENVSFVRPHVPTKWGTISGVEAVLRAMAQMSQSAANPDWLVLLSGTDYPIAPASQVLADLRASEFDAHIHSEPVREGELHSRWQQVAFHRYGMRSFCLPWPKRGAQRKSRWVRLRRKHWKSASCPSRKSYAATSVMPGFVSMPGRFEPSWISTTANRHFSILPEGSITR